MPRGKLIHPDLEPSPTLAYVLGCMLGDGCAHVGKDRRHRLKFTVKDEPLAESFKRAVEKIGLYPYIIQDGRGYYNVYAYSIILLKWYRSLTLKEIKENYLLTSAMKVAFLRGFYESEGNLYQPDPSIKWMRSHRKKHLTRVRIVNTNEALLLLVGRLLSELSYHFRWGRRDRRKYDQKILFSLESTNTKAMTSFLNLIQPCIKGL